MEKNILLTIAYDGSGFHGWQKQPKDRTVQGYLEQTMSRLLKKEIILNGTSRTDAGVHAYGQRASFHTDISIPTERLARVVNNALCGREPGSYAGSPVRIVKAEEVPMDFHARFNCKGKKYIYKIRMDQQDVFYRNYRYFVPGELDIEAMRRGAELLKGKQDFKCFEAAGGNPRETTVRTITGAEIRQNESDGELEFHISGDGFLYNMVRIITGTLVEIGQGKRNADSITEVIESKDRCRAGHTAPPYGLYLAEVYYDERDFAFC